MKWDYALVGKRVVTTSPGINTRSKLWLGRKIQRRMQPPLELSRYIARETARIGEKEEE